MRLVTRFSAVLLLSLLLPLLGTSAQAAAKQHPWAAYYPATGVKCSYTLTDEAGEVVGTEKAKVRKRSGKKIVLAMSSEGMTYAQSVHLLKGGKAGLKQRETLRMFGMVNKVSYDATLPAPSSSAKRRKAEPATMTLRITMPTEMAALATKSGRTVTIAAKYRTSNLGTRHIALADTERTKVRAFGQRTKMTSLKITNAKPEFARQIKKDMRDLFASMATTSWYAKGRGFVLTSALDAEGESLVMRQSSCSR
ncbi:hypothetical protein KG112_13440 [Nocardioides sp. zg-ZUI104]|uniref:hypothetical protein n=1 Tax=Nocardioides faecalis TaxID=2803858 RepID=UPI001BCF384C|nr:hypothetical protein [Nocardioides faecalis]MBS4753812.1 hypothetical protein [Nocardioides faecalis]